ncbi:hypothetical protein [Azospirillum picis]|uniref:Uncharacterized protein n=1 Tax=Azospirillum picis TaxID=488438 RepID=A0ABU0ME98_9PROT|nr:hypothetical protein [Azospirillum picis]MBP2297925.1 hypothetical protein [Azospirillum picis]MDQ0531763.1 hypothetical protein [Azospirillum picis]
MREVAGMPYPAVRSNWGSGVSDDALSGAPVRRGWPGLLGPVAAVVTSVFAATLLAALILHLLVGLAVRLPASDPLGALSVLGGMLVVLATLMPFALLWVRRAHGAWTALQAAPGGGAGGGALTGR